MSLEQILSNIEPNDLINAIQLAVNKSKKPICNQSNDPQKRKKIDDIPSHALIFWVDENKHTILNYRNIELGEDLVAELQKTYKVKFNSAFHDGKIIITGSKSECERHLLLINDQQTIDDETSKIFPKTSKKECSENQILKNKQIQLKDENNILKIKLAEFQQNEKDLKQKLSDMQKELSIANERIEALSNSFSKSF